MHYLWRVIMPLYRPAQTIVLNYSSRIPANAQALCVSADNIDKVSADVLNIILNGNLDYLCQLRSPSDFLEHIAWMVGNTGLRFNVDLALTHYMLGNINECRIILERLVSSRPDLRDHDEVAGTLLDDLKTDPARIASKVQAWERSNIEQFGLSGTTVDIQ